MASKKPTKAPKETRYGIGVDARKRLERESKEGTSRALAALAGADSIVKRAKKAAKAPPKKIARKEKFIPQPELPPGAPTSAHIARNLRSRGIRFFANDNISAHLSDLERELIELEVEGHLQAALRAMVIDVDNDHNTQGTAKRVAKMWMREIFSGRFISAPDVTDFPNVSNLDQVYLVGPIQVNSSCSHHLVPIIGQLWFGVFPGEDVIGLSKFHRMARWIAKRPQIQEEATQMIADELEKVMKPRGLAVMLKARHFCCSTRGVHDPNTWMLTSVVRGMLRDDPLLKQEFFTLLQGAEFGKY